jgi:superoxide reductase
MIGLVEDKGVPVVCCGEKMKELVPNTVEASTEKHLPTVTVSENSISVQVGSIPHPMEDEHFIAFIYVQTKQGGQRKLLKAGAEPKAEFSFINDEPTAVFAYCNLHGLWKTEI